VEYVTLAPGLHVSRVVFGCWAIGRSGWGAVDDRESIEGIRRALDLGVTLFDTADVYGLGHSERILGQALGADRSRVCISTKVGVRWTETGQTSRDCSPAWIAPAIDGSLRRLGTDYIDVCHVHWPDPNTPIADTLAVLEAARAAGKIRHLACSNFPRELFEEASRHATLTSNQLPFNLIDRDKSRAFLNPAPPPAPLLAYGALGQGVLTGKYETRVTFPASDVRSRTGYFDPSRIDHHLHVAHAVCEVAERLGRRPAQIAIRWVLDTPGIACAIVGAKRPAQVEENAAIDFTLPPEDRDWLTESGRSQAEERSNVSTAP
jgi:aryl-alcohol dehydrogenase-like predicted oxidoreductase